jgi:hypothetical protein
MLCLTYRQRLDCLHSSSLSIWLLAVSHRLCAILFSFLVVSPRLPISCFSFLVSCFLVFQFLVFSYLSPGFAFLVPCSRFNTTALLSLSIYTFFSPFSLSSVGSFLSLSSTPRRFDVHLSLMSRMGLRGP